MKIVFLT